MSIELMMPSNLCRPLSCYLQSFPASGSFPRSWLFASGGQSIGASASLLTVNIQGWLPLELTGLISLLSKGLSRVFSRYLAEDGQPKEGQRGKHSKSLRIIIARICKQSRCPSADEWIMKLWYIYTLEYYSAIKKNSFESVLMRWMKLEPIIQSEVSQKDKDHYNY